jgi:hypothetical protein
MSNKDKESQEAHPYAGDQSNNQCCDPDASECGKVRTFTHNGKDVNFHRSFSKDIQIGLEWSNRPRHNNVVELGHEVFQFGTQLDRTCG